MWHILHLIARPIEALLGVFCVLSAIVLYPSEEGKIQSKFEDFWIRVDDFQNLALSRHAAFMAGVAKLEKRFLDRVFGSKLITWHSMLVSFLLSLASIAIVMAIEFHARKLLLEKFWWFTLVGSLAIALSIILRKGLTIVAVAVLLFLLGLAWLSSGYWLSRGQGGLSYLGAAAVITIPMSLSGFVCDAVFIALTRQLLQRAGEMKRSFPILLIVLSNLLLAVVLIGPFVADTLAARNFPYHDVAWPDAPFSPIVYMISQTNVFDTALALLFVLLCVILLVHRALWPLLTRTLFRMTEVGTKGRRAILTAVGLALLSASVFGGKFPELLKEIVKAFGG
jgi:hypothetical protein